MPKTLPIASAWLSGLFRDEMPAVKETYISHLAVRLTLRQGVTISRLRQVEPEVADIATKMVGERELLIRLFTKHKRTPVYLLAELHVSPRLAGRYLLAGQVAPARDAGRGR